MGVVGYFTAEIGLWSELHTYSGGLGVLAGDHVKSAADAEIPLVGVTLVYRKGYGRQHLDKDGVQTETYRDLDPAQHMQDTGMTKFDLHLSTLFSYLRLCPPRHS